MPARKPRPAVARRTTSGEIVARVGLAIAGVAAALVVAEIAVRFLDIGAAPTPRRVVIGGHSKEWCCGPETFDGDVHHFQPNTPFQHCYSGGDLSAFDAAGCVTYRINNHGYRGGDFATAKPADVYRVVAIGDSFTFGEGTSDGDVYPAALQKALAARIDGGRRVEVINLGMPGDDTPAEVATYREVARALHPDWVVLQWTTNDFPASSVQKDHLRLIGSDYREVMAAGDEYHWSRLLSIFARRRRLRAISDALVATTRQEAEAGQASFDDIGRLDGMVKADGAQFTVLVFPELIRFDDYPYAAIVDLLVDYCRGRNIAAVNLLPELSKYSANTLWVHETDHHPNRRAHAIAADALARTAPLAAK